MMEQEIETEGGLVDLDGEDESETAVYEVSYHLMPALSEEELGSIVSKIMDALKAEGANFVGERFPSKISLAYTIAKRVDTVRKNFDESYFGWVAFEINKKALPKIKEGFDAHPSMLRYLLIVTDKNAVVAAMSGGSLAGQTITPTGDIGKPKRAVEEGGEVSEAARSEEHTSELQSHVNLVCRPL